MQNFKEILENYGADYQSTMARFLGKESFYLKMLGMLPDDKNLFKLERSLSLGDLGGAFEAAHTLKGVAGNLGLAPLYRATCQIVEPLRAREQREDYPKMYQAVESEFLKAQRLYERLCSAAGEA